MDFAHTLKNSMESHLKTINDLLFLLRDEQLALQNNDKEKINALSQKKPVLLTSVFEAQQNLFKLTEQQRLSDVIQRLTPTLQAVLVPLWHTLKNAIEEMKTLNTANGITISSRIASIERTMSFFMQKPSSNNAVSYDAKGELQAATRSTGQSKA